MEELKWSLHAIPNTMNNINIPQVDFKISTDASEYGCGEKDGVSRILGIWSTSENAIHKNFFELLAIKHALVNYTKMWKKCQHIRLKSDNTTAMA